MEKTLEKSEDKLRKICDALRKDTLEPAQAEAAKIIADAHTKKERIIREGHQEIKESLQEARAEIEKQRNVFHSSLQQAGKQALESLRQAIEHDLFGYELQRIVEETSANPKLIAKLIEAIVEAIKKEGVETELSAVVAKSVSSKEVNHLIGERILGKLKEKGVTLGSFSGGVQVKLIDRKITLDITDHALMELLAGYVRKDFRNLLFKK